MSWEFRMKSQIRGFKDCCSPFNGYVIWWYSWGWPKPQVWSSCSSRPLIGWKGQVNNRATSYRFHSFQGVGQKLWILHLIIWDKYFVSLYKERVFDQYNHWLYNFLRFLGAIFLVWSEIELLLPSIQVWMSAESSLL